MESWHGGYARKMGLALILIGLVVMFFLSIMIGVILIIAGICLFFVPAAPYGYSRFRRRA